MSTIELKYRKDVSTEELVGFMQGAYGEDPREELRRSLSARVGARSRSVGHRVLWQARSGIGSVGGLGLMGLCGVACCPICLT